MLDVKHASDMKTVLNDGSQSDCGRSGCRSVVGKEEFLAMLGEEVMP